MRRLKVGIVGLPNVGKSTLFQAITKLKVNIANYPFCTIEPNTGIVPVADERIDNLARIYQTKLKIYPTIKLIDIAGLVRGASRGEGLGNAFLGQIREVDLICMVVRCFSAPQIVHHHSQLNPVGDVELIQLEFLLADQQQLVKQIEQLKLKIKKSSGSELQIQTTQLNLMQALINRIENQKPIQLHNYQPGRQSLIESFRLLSLKPILIVANVNEDEQNISSPSSLYCQLKTYCQQRNLALFKICNLFELYWSELSAQDQAVLKSEQTSPRLPQLIKLCYQQLQLTTFYTAGRKQVRGWTYPTGATAVECAGLIHSDFVRHFIRARVFNYDQLTGINSLPELKSKVIIRTEGRDYMMKDGDICYFDTSG